MATIPTPEAGLVIAYAYLWRREHQAGQDEGLKGRPSVIVLAVERPEDGATVVTVLPTHIPRRPGRAPLSRSRRRSSAILDSTINALGWSLPRAMRSCGPDTTSGRSRTRTAMTLAFCRRDSSTKSSKPSWRCTRPARIQRHGTDHLRRCRGRCRGGMIPIPGQRPTQGQQAPPLSVGEQVSCRPIPWLALAGLRRLHRGR